MQTNHSKYGRYGDQRGFTLVELVIALLVSLVIMAGVSSVFISHSRQYSQQDDIVKVMPFIAARILAAMSSSMKGRISRVISMTVTSEPRVEYKDANSTPMTPPPMTARRLGTSGRERMPVESTTTGLSFTPGIGGTAGTEPVAMMTCSAVY